MKKLITIWLLIGVVVGAVGLGVTNYVLHATSTDEFCSSCHTNDVVPEWKESVHYTNEYAVRAGCANCHLPEAFFPKMKRKMMAIKEVYGYFTGVIDSKEKFEAKRLEMAENEWARMRANGNAECKTCHHMAELKPNDEAKSFLPAMHQQSLENGMVCIDCHKGVAHKAP